MALRHKISVCIIAKNEEAVIQDCLESVVPFADEIILVDTGSQDRTKEIALRFNAQVYDFQWNNDFSAARNESISHANYEFIFIIDADERVLNPAEVVATAQNAASGVGGWTCDMVSTFTAHDGTVERNITNVLRFFRNDKRFKFKGIIHEQIAHSIIAANYTVQKSQIACHHIGYDLSADIMTQKYSRNLDLLNKWLAEHPDDEYNWQHKARTLLALKRLDEAETEFEKILGSMGKTNALRLQVLNYAAICAYQNSHIDRAFEWANESFDIMPAQAFANFILGEIYYQRQDIPHALEAYLNMQKAAENPSNTALLAGDYQIAPEQMHWRIGRCLLAINELQDAAAEFEKGLKLAPANPFCMVGIANVAFKTKKYDEAKKILEIALQYNPQHTEIVDFIREVDEKIHASNIRKAASNTMQTAPDAAPLLSLCMIVKNEEKMLEGCLQSVDGVVDEIIIVDTGSTDKTVDIARRYNAQVKHFQWIDDFSAARNESIKYATGKWILYLDADERLTAQSHAQIRHLLDTAAPETGAYFCLIESDHYKLDGSSEKHSGGYPRLFRNLGYPDVKFAGRVHEQISPSIIANNKAMLMSEIVIEHLGYNLTHEEMHRKVQRNYRMLLAHIKEEPTYGYAWFQLGQTLGQMRLFEQAEEATLFAIKCGNLSDSVYASAAAMLSQLAGIKKNYSESLKWADETLSKVPKQLFGLSLKAHSLLYLGRKAEAAEYFQKALDVLKSNKSIPQSGFDINISEEALQNGLRQAIG